MPNYIPIVIIVILISASVYAFNRSPDRVTPCNDCIVSPAMGRVIAIHELSDTHLSFFKDDIANDISVDGVTLPAYVVIIELNLRDVHVQRAPIDGMVTKIERYEGKHGNALRSKTKYDLVNANEKVLSLFKNKVETVGVVQVAGIAARRIRTNVKVSDIVTKGQVYGRILLGSQVVLIIPHARTLQVGVGDRVIDGETVVAQ